MIRVELAKQLMRPRTFLTLAALAGFPVLLTIALAATGAGRAETVGDIPLLVVPSSSVFSVPLIALSSTMKFFLPLAVSVFAGEAVAGELRWGSLRYMLARGVSRSRVLAAKAAVASIFSLAAVVLVPGAALLVGTVAFGWHPLAATDGGSSTGLQPALATFDAGATLARLAMATGYVAAGMTSIFAFAFFLSTATGRPLVAVAGGVGMTIISRVLNADYLPGVGVLSPYLPNNDVDLWQHFFQQPAQTDGVLHFLVLQLVYVAVFGSLAWWWFSRTDVLE
ncbi:MAG: ABC transporter permease [Candidatus Dormibacteraeota bacterium]|nr:ABC transporter permease [Candidatus Dormibacteraeota bacterium]